MYKIQIMMNDMNVAKIWTQNIFAFNIKTLTLHTSFAQKLSMIKY